MRFTLNWLKKFLDTSSTLEEIAHGLTNCGLEVEDIDDRAPALSSLIVAEITACHKADGSKKLNICTVDTGSEKLQIVCGGANARAGIKVVLAPVGSIIPNGNFKIKASKIRGIESNGMLCSSVELNLDGLLPCPDDGIIELDESCQIGQPISHYYGLDDPIIHINITPNRADALGVYGIAKDLAACGLGQLKPLDIPKIKPSFNSQFSLTVIDSDTCPYFALYQIKNISNRPSPPWLQNWLLAIGLTPVSAIVDITNYISYSFGQPMHVYDASKIKSGLRVAPATDKQNFMALNDKEYQLQAGDLVISDENRAPHCLAGVIGGLESSANLETNNILLEAAIFSPKLVMQAGRRHNIETDSRYRFERYVNSEFTPQAIAIAAAMILELCGGEASELIEQGNSQQELRQIKMPLSFFSKRMGYEISPARFEQILKSLGFSLQQPKTDDNYTITIPASRFDVSIKEDILEEICRIDGYDNIPTTELADTNLMAKIIPAADTRHRIMQRHLASRGYLETISYSFTSSKVAGHFAPIEDKKFITNPISSELDYMRPTIAPCLLQVAAKNLARQQDSLALFELGPVFGEQESTSLCTFRTGQKYANNWHEATRNIDVYDLKAELESVLAEAGLEPTKLRLSQEKVPPYYHPTRSGTLSLGKNIIATFGEVHPSTLELFSIKQAVMMFEVNLDLLPPARAKFGRRPGYQVSNIQSVWRDYAFIIPADKPAAELLKLVSGVDKQLIKSTEIFDVYSGPELGDNNRSIALRVQIHNPQKTMTEAEIKPIHEAIISKAEGAGAKLRIT